MLIFTLLLLVHGSLFRILDSEGSDEMLNIHEFLQPPLNNNPLYRVVNEIPSIQTKVAFELGSEIYSSITWSALGMTIEISANQVKCGSVIYSAEDHLNLTTDKLLIDDRAFCKFPIDLKRGQGSFLLAGVLSHGAPHVPDSFITMNDLLEWQHSMIHVGHKIILVRIKMVSEEEYQLKHLII